MLDRRNVCLAYIHSFPSHRGSARKQWPTWPFHLGIGMGMDEDPERVAHPLSRGEMPMARINSWTAATIPNQRKQIFLMACLTLLSGYPRACLKQAGGPGPGQGLVAKMTPDTWRFFRHGLLPVERQHDRSNFRAPLSRIRRRASRAEPLQGGYVFMTPALPHGSRGCCILYTGQLRFTRGERGCRSSHVAVATAVACRMLHAASLHVCC